MIAVDDYLILSLASCTSALGVSLAGFGHGILYIFVWQIAALSGYNGLFKYAIFIQSLSLLSVQVSGISRLAESDRFATYLMRTNFFVLHSQCYCTHQTFVSMPLQEC
jgi:hypothetical protein